MLDGIDDQITENHAEHSQYDEHGKNNDPPDRQQELFPYGTFPHAAKSLIDAGHQAAKTC